MSSTIQATNTNWLCSAKHIFALPTQRYNCYGFPRSAPTMHVTYNAATNRQSTDTADANGNILGSPYSYLQNIFDIDNRLVQPGNNATIAYSYDAGNKRIWRGDSSAGLDELDFFTGNQKIGTYQISSDSNALYFTLKTTNVYFGGKLVSKGTASAFGADHLVLTPIAADRLGSIGKFYPYGQERPSATANDAEKFTGYFRDAATGLDYADQRYHQVGQGRFLTPDRAHSGMNWYAYVGGDPVNNVDPSGETALGSDCMGGYVSSICGMGAGGWGWSGSMYSNWEIPDQRALGYNGPQCPVCDAFAQYQGQVQSAQTAAAASIGITLTFGPGGATVTPTPVDPNFVPQGPCQVGVMTKNGCSGTSVTATIEGGDPTTWTHGFTALAWAQSTQVNLSDSRPSCFGVFTSGFVKSFNPLTISASSFVEPAAAAGQAYNYNRALSYAASTASRTYGTTHLVYPFKSSVFRGLLGKAGPYATAAQITIGLAYGLGDEFTAAAAGDCAPQ